jgi:methylthioribose-1-phosphate isomerase
MNSPLPGFTTLEGSGPTPIRAMLVRGAPLIGATGGLRHGLGLAQ